MSRKVLVLSESFGLGHERAAQALIKGLTVIEPGVETLHANSIYSSFPRLTGAFLGLYLQMLNRFPRVWHRIYQNGRRNMENTGSKKIVYRLLAGAIKKIIDGFRPDAVVCTHPFPAAAISRLKEEGLNIPLIGIVTDYDIHAYWLDQNIDLYIVGDSKLEEDFAALNFNPRRVSGAGIPIDPVFGRRDDRAEVRARLGLEQNAPVLLVAGGGWGLGDLGRIVDLLTAMAEGFHIIVVTGTNLQLRKILQQKYAAAVNVSIEGLVTNIHEYMTAVDIMVTKPGGLTTSEGLASGVPMVLFDVFYGQEEWNARFLTENGAAVKCGRLAEIPQKVRQIIENTKESKLLREKALALGKPSAGTDAAENVLQLA